MEDLADETVLTLHGELDSWTRQAFVAALDGVKDNVGRIVLELSDLTFIDVGSIGLLHRARRLARLRGADLVLRAPSPYLLRTLELTGIRVNDPTDDEIGPVLLPMPSRVYAPPPRA